MTISNERLAEFCNSSWTYSGDDALSVYYPIHEEVIAALRELQAARELEREVAMLREALEVADEALVWKHMPDGSIVQEHSADNITHPDCNRCKAAAVVRAALSGDKPCNCGHCLDCLKRERSKP